MLQPSLAQAMPIGGSWSMANEPVLIFGKDSCPYTQAARDDFARRKIPVQYFNVKKSPTDLERMLGYSRGRREVPVIIENGKVTIGFGGT
jgi:glutaredoxin 3